jgi:hypothetical protein
MDSLLNALRQCEAEADATCKLQDECVYVAPISPGDLAE